MKRTSPGESLSYSTKQGLSLCQQLPPSQCALSFIWCLIPWLFPKLSRAFCQPESTATQKIQSPPLLSVPSASFRPQLFSWNSYIFSFFQLYIFVHLRASQKQMKGRLSLLLIFRQVISYWQQGTLSGFGRSPWYTSDQTLALSTTPGCSKPAHQTPEWKLFFCPSCFYIPHSAHFLWEN